MPDTTLDTVFVVFQWCAKVRQSASGTDLALVSTTDPPGRIGCIGQRPSRRSSAYVRCAASGGPASRSPLKSVSRRPPSAEGSDARASEPALYAQNQRQGRAFHPDRSQEWAYAQTHPTSKTQGRRAVDLAAKIQLATSARQPTYIRNRQSAASASPGITC
jgi:hypothetical protein